MPASRLSPVTELHVFGQALNSDVSRLLTSEYASHQPYRKVRVWSNGNIAISEWCMKLDGHRRSIRFLCSSRQIGSSRGADNAARTNVDARPSGYPASSCSPMQLDMAMFPRGIIRSGCHVVAAQSRDT